MKKNLSPNAVSLVFIALLLSSLILWSPNISHAQGAMTFTSGNTVSFHSDTEMTFKSGVSMTFWSGIKMGFGTGIQTMFSAPTGWIQVCTDYTVIAGSIPWACSWWELLDQATGQPTGVEFHVDKNPTATSFHIDEVRPGAVQVNPAQPVVAELKIDSLYMHVTTLLSIGLQVLSLNLVLGGK